MKKLLMTIVIFLSSFILSFSQTNFWESTNGPFGGEVEAVAIKSNGKVLVGTSTSGIFRSDGTGDNWQPVTSGLPIDSDSVLFEKINALAINSMDWIFAGTHAGVYLSSDNGDNWIATSLAGEDIRITLLFIDSADQIFANYSEEIYISTDDGTTWQQPATPLSGITSLAENSQGNLFAGNFDGVHISTDGGDNWTQTNLTSGINSLTIDSQDQIFAGTSGVFRSTDNGDSWSLFHILPDSLYEVQFFTASPGNQLYAGVWDNSGDRDGVYRSTNSGVSWEKVNQGLADSLNLRYITTNSAGDVFAGTEHGLFRTTNNGNDWHLFGIPGTFIASISFTEGTVFAETFWEFTRGILFRSLDNEGIWERVNDGIENTIVFDIIEIPSGDLLCGSLNGIFRSTDEGSSWITDALHNNNVNVLNSNSAGQIFAGTDAGIYRSTDNGGSWNPGGLTNEDIGRLALNSIDYLFAVTASNGIFFSTDSGDSWSPVGDGISTNTITDIAITTNDYIFAATDNGVFRSTDDGISWLVVNNGISITEYAWTLSVDNLNNIYVGTLGQGVFKSTNNGDDWIQINDGLVNHFIYSMKNSPDNYLFAGTFGNGIYRRDITTGIFNAYHTGSVTSFILEQNYPNPFNPSTTIKFSLPSSSFAILKIYDALGEEAAVLLNRELTSGTFEVEWNATGLPSGIYFYKLQANEFAQVKKMILLK
ncbi:MAG: T9SS type A sorting domain-containing protein [Bacteroidetes bacterium]|nr:T9SS type A sorting domain-containing protein [Bacteroidota bacterium]